MTDMFKAFTKKLGEWWRAEGEKRPDAELWPLHGIPKEYSRKAEPRGSIYQAPLEVDVTGIGQIKQAGGLAKALRKIMQAEMKARGPVSEVRSIPGEPKLFSDVLRGTYYHGRGTLPEAEKLLEKPFKGVRAREGNIGEPTGISITYRPKVAAKFSKVPDPEAMKDYDFVRTDKIEPELYRYEVTGHGYGQYWDVYAKNIEEAKQKLVKEHGFTGTKIARVMPLFGGAPEKNILKAWDPKAGAEFKDAYKKAVKQMVEKHEWMRGNATDYLSFKDALEEMGETGRKLTLQFNELVTETLKEKGYKGVLYSPHRYGEYELRMFNPEDVLMLEQRSLKEKGMQRAWGTETKPGPARDIGTRFATILRDKPSSLRDWYEEIDFEEIMKGVK